MINELQYTDAVAEATQQIYEKLSGEYTESHWRTIAPLVYEINRLKKERNAIIIAHNYMTPDIFYGVGDVVGDSLKLAQVAAETEAEVIVQAGVHFMAETAKILNMHKTVLMPDMKAGCSLAESITGADVRLLREKYPGVPIVTYVNTSADVKAESDVCCTSSNAVKIVEALDEDEVLMIPDQYLAQYVQSKTAKKVHTWKGSCMVHERFTADEIRKYRERYPGITVLAHPECPQDVLQEADYTGSTSQINDYVENKRPRNVILITECSMSDNVQIANPDLNLIRPCQLCPHMKRITLPKILKCLQDMAPAVHVDPDIAARARRSIDRMLELS